MTCASPASRAEDAPLYAHHFTPKFAATAANQTIVTAPNQQSSAAARRTTGAMAEATERGKLTNVKTRYHIPPATEYKLSPFGVDVTGALGAHARRLCAAIVDAAPRHDEADEDGDVVVMPEVADADVRRVRSKRLWRCKARVAAVFRGNAAILAKYGARLHGEPA